MLLKGRAGETLTWMATALTLLAAAGLAASAAAQPAVSGGIRVLAVAPFFDDDPLHRELAVQAAILMSGHLRRAAVKIVEPARVAAEMGRLGLPSGALISPSRTVEVGQSLGADAVVTGRLTEVFQEVSRARSPSVIGSSIEGRVAVDIRLLDVRTRLKLYEEEIFCSASAPAAVAMECVAREAAARVAARLPRN